MTKPPIESVPTLAGRELDRCVHEFVMERIDDVHLRGREMIHSDLSMESIREMGEDNIRILNGKAADIVFDLASAYPPQMVKFMLMKAAMLVASKDGSDFIRTVYDANNRCC